MPNIRGTFVTKFVAENFPNSANHVTLLNNTSSNEQTKFQVLLKTKKLFLKNFKTGVVGGKAVGRPQECFSKFFWQRQETVRCLLAVLMPTCRCKQQGKRLSTFLTQTLSKNYWVVTLTSNLAFYCFQFSGKNFSCCCCCCCCVG